MCGGSGLEAVKHLDVLVVLFLSLVLPSSGITTIIGCGIGVTVLSTGGDYTAVCASGTTPSIGIAANRVTVTVAGSNTICPSIYSTHSCDGGVTVVASDAGAQIGTASTTPISFASRLIGEVYISLGAGVVLSTGLSSTPALVFSAPSGSLFTGLTYVTISIVGVSISTAGGGLMEVENYYGTIAFTVDLGSSTLRSSSGSSPYAITLGGSVSGMALTASGADLSGGSSTTAWSNFIVSSDASTTISSLAITFAGVTCGSSGSFLAVSGANSLVTGFSLELQSPASVTSSTLMSITSSVKLLAATLKAGGSINGVSSTLSVSSSFFTADASTTVSALSFWFDNIAVTSGGSTIDIQSALVSVVSLTATTSSTITASSGYNFYVANSVATSCSIAVSAGGNVLQALAGNFWFAGSSMVSLTITISGASFTAGTLPTDSGTVNIFVFGTVSFVYVTAVNTKFAASNDGVGLGFSGSISSGASSLQLQSSTFSGLGLCISISASPVVAISMRGISASLTYSGGHAALLSLDSSFGTGSTVTVASCNIAATAASGANTLFPTAAAILASGSSAGVTVSISTVSITTMSHATSLAGIKFGNDIAASSASHFSLTVYGLTLVPVANSDSRAGSAVLLVGDVQYADIYVYCTSVTALGAPFIAIAGKLTTCNIVLESVYVDLVYTAVWLPSSSNTNVAVKLTRCWIHSQVIVTSPVSPVAISYACSRYDTHTTMSSTSFGALSGSATSVACAPTLASKCWASSSYTVSFPKTQSVSQSARRSLSNTPTSEMTLSKSQSSSSSDSSSNSRPSRSPSKSISLSLESSLSVSQSISHSESRTFTMYKSLSDSISGTKSASFDVSMTVTNPSRTATASSEITRSFSNTGTETPSSTASETGSETVSSEPTRSVSESHTTSVSSERSRSVTITKTTSRSVSLTTDPTASDSASPPTPTKSTSLSWTFSESSTRSQSGEQTASRTKTSERTETHSTTLSSSTSLSLSRGTPTATFSESASNSLSQAKSQSESLNFTITVSRSRSSSPSVSVSLSRSLSEEPSSTTTASTSFSEELTASATSSQSRSVSDSFSVSFSTSSTSSTTREVSASFSSSFSTTQSEELSSSQSWSTSDSLTRSFTSDVTKSETKELSESFSPTLSRSLSIDGTSTRSSSLSKTLSRDMSETISESITISFSRSLSTEVSSTAGTLSRSWQLSLSLTSNQTTATNSSTISESPSSTITSSRATESFFWTQSRSTSGSMNQPSNSRTSSLSTSVSGNEPTGTRSLSNSHEESRATITDSLSLLTPNVTSTATLSNDDTRSDSLVTRATRTVTLSEHSLTREYRTRTVTESPTETRTEGARTVTATRTLSKSKGTVTFDSTVTRSASRIAKSKTRSISASVNSASRIARSRTTSYSGDDSGTRTITATTEVTLTNTARDLSPSHSITTSSTLTHDSMSMPRSMTISATQGSKSFERSMSNSGGNHTHSATIVAPPSPTKTPTPSTSSSPTTSFSPTFSPTPDRSLSSSRSHWSKSEAATMSRSYPTATQSATTILTLTRSETTSLSITRQRRGENENVSETRQSTRSMATMTMSQTRSDSVQPGPSRTRLRSSSRSFSASSDGTTLSASAGMRSGTASSSPTPVRQTQSSSATADSSQTRTLRKRSPTLNESSTVSTNFSTSLSEFHRTMSETPNTTSSTTAALSATESIMATQEHTQSISVSAASATHGPLTGTFTVTAMMSETVSTSISPVHATGSETRTLHVSGSSVLTLTLTKRETFTGSTDVTQTATVTRPLGRKRLTLTSSLVVNSDFGGAPSFATTFGAASIFVVSIATCDSYSLLYVNMGLLLLALLYALMRAVPVLGRVLCLSRTQTFRNVSIIRSLLVQQVYLSVVVPCHFQCAFAHVLLLLFHFDMLVFILALLLVNIEPSAVFTGVVCSLIAVGLVQVFRPILNVMLYQHDVCQRRLVRRTRRRDVEKLQQQRVSSRTAMTEGLAANSESRIPPGGLDDEDGGFEFDWDVKSSSVASDDILEVMRDLDTPSSVESAAEAADGAHDKLQTSAGDNSAIVHVSDADAYPTQENNVINPETGSQQSEKSSSQKLRRRNSMLSEVKAQLKSKTDDDDDDAALDDFLRNQDLVRHSFRKKKKAIPKPPPVADTVIPMVESEEESEESEEIEELDVLGAARDMPVSVLVDVDEGDFVAASSKSALLLRRPSTVRAGTAEALQPLPATEEQGPRRPSLADRRIIRPTSSSSMKPSGTKVASAEEGQNAAAAASSSSGKVPFSIYAKDTRQVKQDPIAAPSPMKTFSTVLAVQKVKNKLLKKAKLVGETSSTGGGSSHDSSSQQPSGGAGGGPTTTSSPAGGFGGLWSMTPSPPPSLQRLGTGNSLIMHQHPNALIEFDDIDVPDFEQEFAVIGDSDIQLSIRTGSTLRELRAERRSSFAYDLRSTSSGGEGEDLHSGSSSHGGTSKQTGVGGGSSKLPRNRNEDSSGADDISNRAHTDDDDDDNWMKEIDAQAILTTSAIFVPYSPPAPPSALVHQQKFASPLHDTAPSFDTPRKAAPSAQEEKTKKKRKVVVIKGDDSANAETERDRGGQDDLLEKVDDAPAVVAVWDPKPTHILSRVVEGDKVQVMPWDPRPVSPQTPSIESASTISVPGDLAVFDEVGHDDGNVAHRRVGGNHFGMRLNSKRFQRQNGAGTAADGDDVDGSDDDDDDVNLDDESLPHTYFISHVVRPYYRRSALVLVVCCIVAITLALVQLNLVASQTSAFVCTHFLYWLIVALLVDVIIVQQVYAFLLFAWRYQAVNDSHVGEQVFSELHPLQKELRRVKLSEEYFMSLLDRGDETGDKTHVEEEDGEVQDGEDEVQDGGEDE